jgi:hypothetical protein
MYTTTSRWVAGADLQGAPPIAGAYGEGEGEEEVE